jgi:hypothetical protein
MQHQVSALSDSQVEEQLRGQRPAVVEEVTNIYSHARNQALGYALASVGAAGLIGLIASFGLPSAPASARDDDAPRG